jgi:hypothetical protein
VYKGKLAPTRRQVSDLTDELKQALKSQGLRDAVHSPADHMYFEGRRNYGRPPNGRRYSPEILLSAREVRSISPKPWNVVRLVLPLPAECSLFSYLTESRRTPSDALEDIDRVSELIDVWPESIPADIYDRMTLLAVDAVAFRPSVTVDEEGSVHGLKNLMPLDDRDRFTQFLAHSWDFARFSQNNCAQAYSALLLLIFSPLIRSCPAPSFTWMPLSRERGQREP